MVIVVYIPDGTNVFMIKLLQHHHFWHRMMRNHSWNEPIRLHLLQRHRLTKVSHLFSIHLGYLLKFLQLRHCLIHLAKSPVTNLLQIHKFSLLAKHVTIINSIWVNILNIILPIEWIEFLLHYSLSMLIQPFLFIDLWILKIFLIFIIVILVLFVFHLFLLVILVLNKKIILR